jgi:hypothetical protein
MNQNLGPVDQLVSNIVGTANFIGKILFNRNSVIAAAVVSFVVILLVLAT